MSDVVHQPDHYAPQEIGGVECVDALRSALGHDGFMAYCAGNCIKYLWRSSRKNGVEDLEKARVYLNWMIEASIK